MYTDVFLARFCLQNSLRDKKTAAQLRKAVAWRDSVGANAYRSAFVSGQQCLSFPSVVRFMTYAPIYPGCGFTQRGEWLEYLPLLPDPKRFMSSMTDEEFCEGCLAINEFLYATLDRLTLERGDGQLVRLFPVSDVSYITKAHISLALIRRMQKTAVWPDLYYPWILSSTAILNVPGFVVGAWKMLSLILSEDMRSKFHLYPPQTSAEASEGRLFEILPRELVPVNLGGELRQLKPEHSHMIGFDMLDAETLRSICPGPTTVGVGRIHLPHPDHVE